MAETLDQIFVLLKHWLLGYVPVGLQPITSGIITVVPILIGFPLLFALTTVWSAKAWAAFRTAMAPTASVQRDSFSPSPTD